MSTLQMKLSYVLIHEEQNHKHDKQSQLQGTVKSWNWTKSENVVIESAIGNPQFDNLEVLVALRKGV